MPHKQKLEKIYKLSCLRIKQQSQKKIILPTLILEDIHTIGKKISSQKGVFTILVTLFTHKILYPTQDIRYHQSSMQNGFSGRSIDTKQITPTLKELGLPSMSESGWLTRSLEQPFPYTLKYQGKISNKKVKTAFLTLIDYIQKIPSSTNDILELLLVEAIKVSNQLKVPITPLSNPEKITIQNCINALLHHFNKNYKIHGGAKLPVLAFYALYELLITEIKRYNNCTLAKLGSHTASDKSSKSAGDIEILKNNLLYEAIEIKLDKKIRANTVRIAIEKIHKFNLKRYYILSHIGTDAKDLEIIEQLIFNTKKEHGCQIIVNGVIPSIKYYLRLIDNPQEFVIKYSALIEKDSELKKIHKVEWNHIISQHLN